MASVGVVALTSHGSPASDAADAKSIPPSPTPKGIKITGSFVLRSREGISTAKGAPCSGSGGYSDIGEGTSVTVKDQSGTIVGVGKLVGGVRESDFGFCRFTFEVTGIPKATFYSIEVGHRGAITYSFKDMTDKGWMLDLTLG